MKMLILAGGFLLAAELSWGAETAPFGSVVGWWRFNESPYKADSSGNGNAIDSFAVVCKSVPAVKRGIVILVH